MTRGVLVPLEYEDAVDLLDRLLNKKPFAHESVLEHANYTVLIECSRAISHQLVRHRHCAFTQDSTRYNRYTLDPNLSIGSPARIIMPMDFSVEPCMWATNSLALDKLNSMYVSGAVEAITGYENALAAGVKREEARKLLPHCLATRVVVTANIRQWRNMLKLRMQKGASTEIRILFGMIYEQLLMVSPMLLKGIDFPKSTQRLCAIVSS
jgi:thymidylate synthase (FAD)